MNKYAFYNFKYGILKIAYNDINITYLKKVDNIDQINEFSSISDKAFTQIQEYLDKKRTNFDLPFEISGTKFQNKVWNELCNIPYGETRTYKDIAIAIKNSKAYRAVGMANNKNPLTIIVPCHRVIGTSGKLVGYAGGNEMKNSLLQLENEYINAK